MASRMRFSAILAKKSMEWFLIITTEAQRTQRTTETI
jgi:hypothetical protein